MLNSALMHSLNTIKCTIPEVRRAGRASKMLGAKGSLTPPRCVKLTTLFF